LPDIPYFTGAPVIHPQSSASRKEVTWEMKYLVFQLGPVSHQSPHTYRPCGVTKHRTGRTVRTGPQHKYILSKRHFEVVVVLLSTAGRFRWCGLRPRLGALLLIQLNRPMAHRLKVRRKQSSFNTQNIRILGAGAAGAVFRDTHRPCIVATYSSIYGMYHCTVRDSYT